MDYVQLFLPLVVFGAIAAIVYIQRQFTPEKREQRRAQATPSVAVKELMPGSIAKVRGRVVLDAVLQSPVTHQRCAYWRVEVDHEDHDPDSNQFQWISSFDRELRRDFRLQDATGTVHVVAGAAVMDLLRMVEKFQNTFLPEHLKALLLEGGESLDRPPLYKWRITERTVLEGSEFEATGLVRTGPDGPVLDAAPDKPVVITEVRPPEF